MNRRLRNLVGWVLTLGIIVLPHACDSSGGNEGEDVAAVFDTSGPADVVADLPEEDVPDLLLGSDGGELIRLSFPQYNGANLRVPADGGLVVRIEKRNLTTDEPLAGEALDFTLRPIPSGNGELAASQTVTGEDGIGLVRFAAGDVAPSSYVLTASSAGAVDAELRIDVTTSPAGGARVAMSYGGTATVEDVRVYLMPQETLDCEGFDPSAPPDDYLDMLEAESILDGPVRFDGIFVGEGWGFFALAGPAGAPTVAGCTDGVRVKVDEDAPVTLELNDLGG